MDLLTPRRFPNSALTLHTQKQCTARGSSSGFSIPVSWPLKAPGSTFWGRVAKPLISSLDASTPTGWIPFLSSNQQFQSTEGITNAIRIHNFHTSGTADNWPVSLMELSPAVRWFCWECSDTSPAARLTTEHIQQLHASAEWQSPRQS